MQVQCHTAREGQPQESEHFWSHCLLTQVQCHTAREGHPWRIFSWGNHKSLNTFGHIGCSHRCNATRRERAPMAHLQLGQPQESEHVWAHWLLTQVQCHTAREGHPWRIFSWGNRKSLVDMP